ncbi:MAG: hypothetical protein U0166_10890 [Acidobacteriota bacterium]
MKWLLNLYPKAWRERYGAEMGALLEERPGSIALAVDLIAGAIDARMQPAPQAAPVPAGAGGDDMTTTMLRRCASGRVLTTREQLLGALFVIAGTAAITAIYAVLKAAFGSTPAVEALGGTAYLFPLVLYSGYAYLGGHSRTAQVVLVGGPMAFAYLLQFLAYTFAARL